MGLLTSSLSALGNAYMLNHQRQNLEASRRAYQQKYWEWYKNVGSQGRKMAGSKQLDYDARMLGYFNSLADNKVQQINNMSRWLV